MPKPISPDANYYEKQIRPLIHEAETSAYRPSIRIYGVGVKETHTMDVTVFQLEQILNILKQG